MIMKKCLLIPTLLIVGLIWASVSLAAPNIDGYLYYTDSNDWKDVGTRVTQIDRFNSLTKLTNVMVEKGDYSGDNYDIQELAVYIENDTLYFAIQTEYDLKKNQSGTTAGDFLFDFDAADNDGKIIQDDWGLADFGFDFDITGDQESGFNVDLTLLVGGFEEGSAENTKNNHINGTTDYNNFNTDYQVTQVSDAATAMEFKFATPAKNQYEAAYTRKNEISTIEAMIDLAKYNESAVTALLDLFSKNDSVVMYWQPSCGNDFLAAQTAIPGSPGGGSHAPEPATTLLFGMGLLGASALGRRKSLKN